MPDHHRVPGPTPSGGGDRTDAGTAESAKAETAERAQAGTAQRTRPDSPTLHGSGGTRLAWTDLPAVVRTAIEDRAGARVVRADSQVGGFSPGMASRLLLSDGRRVFVKAVSSAQNPGAPGFYRREARIAARLPRTVPAPALLWCHDDGEWVVLAFEDVDGRPPVLPWRAAEHDRVLAALTDLSTLLTPSPVPADTLAEANDAAMRGWRSLAAEPSDWLTGLDPWARARLSDLAEHEARWVDAAAGDTLLHCDMRADNILLTAERVVFVDWPSAALGAPWFDLVILLPSLSMQGGGDPESIVSAHPLTRGVDAATLTAVLTAVAGYFVYSSRQPAPPGLPRVREFQRAQGVAALRWLRMRWAG